MDIAQLFESETSDSIERTMAVSAFDSIKDWLSRNLDRLAEILIPHPQYPGSLVFSASRAGLSDDLVILLLPQSLKVGDQHVASASFGTTKQGASIIALPILIAPNDLRHIDTRFGFRKREFVHEYMHYLMHKKRTDHRIGSSVAAHSNDYASYYNDDDETNAYYQEAAQDIIDIFNALIRAGDPARQILVNYSEKSMAELVNDMKAKFFDKEFLKFASEKTMRALNKRLARLLSKNILPKIRTALA